MSATNNITKKMLQAFKPIKLYGKQDAIMKIKMQPFFGAPLFNNKSDTVTFKRPTDYIS